MQLVLSGLGARLLGQLESLPYNLLLLPDLIVDLLLFLGLLLLLLELYLEIKHLFDILRVRVFLVLLLLLQLVKGIGGSGGE